ncbi:MAG: hypothetical protein AB8H86_21580 [Polyangiales bacterium]
MKLWAIFGAAFGLWLGSSAAGAQEEQGAPDAQGEGPRLSFNAPEHCGDEALFRDLVAARLGDDPFGSGLALFRLEIRSAEGESNATLHIIGESGELSQRAFRNPSCPELMEEVAASLASLVAEIPQARPTPAPIAPAPVPLATPTAQPVDTVDTVDAVDNHPADEPTWRLGGGLAAGLRFDTGGDAYVGGRGLFFAQRGPWSVRARVAFGMSPQARVQPVLGVSPDLRLIRVGGGADACRRFQAWSVCAGITAGALRAQLAGDSSNSAPFASVDLEAGVDVVRGSAGALRLYVGASVGLAGADATLNGTEFWSSGLMSVALWVGYESPSE